MVTSRKSVLQTPTQPKRDKWRATHRPAEMVHVSDAWPILSKDIAFTARDQMRKSDVTPEHVARRLVDHHDSVRFSPFTPHQGCTPS